MSANVLNTPLVNTPRIAKPKRYHPALVALHWIIAILIFATPLFAEDGGEGFSPGGVSTLGIHMILGIAVLVLLVIRLIIRWRTQHPDWATAGGAFLDKIGGLTHWALYFFTFAITITGIALVAQTNRFARVFGLGGVARPQFMPGGFEVLGAFHGLSWTLLLLLILLHVGAALYHQFIRKDNLLSRMWFGGQYE